jgi:ABC-2 type transport system ATP-binding protein
MKAITVNNLTKYYGDNLGVKDISFEVEKGTIHGFIGPNGAGKSTTLKVLLNVILPTTGHGNILGLDILHDIKEIKLITGYLPSEINIYENEKVENLLMQTLKYYSDISINDYPKLKGLGTIFELSKEDRIKEMKSNINRLSSLLNIASQKKFGELSFGNKKKVGLAISMIHSPIMLILDEPTGGLDPLMQDEYFKLLKEENEKGVTIFFSSHILSEVERVCEKVTIIKEGQIIESTSIDKLKGRSIKNIKITIDPENFQALDKVIDGNKTFTNVKKGETEFAKIVSFTYVNDINTLLEKLKDITLKDINITDPTLEEAFRHYYEERK